MGLNANARTVLWSRHLLPICRAARQSFALCKRPTSRRIRQGRVENQRSRRDPILSSDHSPFVDGRLCELREHLGVWSLPLPSRTSTSQPLPAPTPDATALHEDPSPLVPSPSRPPPLRPRRALPNLPFLSPWTRTTRRLPGREPDRNVLARMGRSEACRCPLLEILFGVLRL